VQGFVARRHPESELAECGYATECPVPARSSHGIRVGFRLRVPAAACDQQFATAHLPAQVGVAEPERSQLGPGEDAQVERVRVDCAGRESVDVDLWVDC